MSLGIAAVLFVAVGAAAFFILKRSAPRRPAPSPVPTFPASFAPTAAPTAGPDEVVIAPRIIEQRTPTEPEPLQQAPTRPPPTPAPPPAATKPPPATPARSGDPGDAPLEGTLTAAKLKRHLDLWSGRPIERRAHRALEVVNAVNFWTVTHPDDPYTQELRRSLPRTLKSEAETALTEGQPILARLFYRAYRQLRFSPPDPDLARRMRQGTS